MQLFHSHQYRGVPIWNWKNGPKGYYYHVVSWRRDHIEIHRVLGTISDVQIGTRNLEIRGGKSICALAVPEDEVQALDEAIKAGRIFWMTPEINRLWQAAWPPTS